VTGVLAIVVLLAVTAFIILPLLGGTEDGLPDALPGSGERWNREKAVAVLAITEADFDLATGKLSDEDHRVLLADYEGRALQAMEEIERLAPAPAPAESGINFCPSCGRRFEGGDAFCGGCGRPRAAV
jgi:hypothetical protein